MNGSVLRQEEVPAPATRPVGSSVKAAECMIEGLPPCWPRSGLSVSMFRRILRTAPYWGLNLKLGANPYFRDFAVAFFRSCVPRQ